MKDLIKNKFKSIFLQNNSTSIDEVEFEDKNGHNSLI